MLISNVARRYKTAWLVKRRQVTANITVLQVERLGKYLKREKRRKNKKDCFKLYFSKTKQQQLFEINNKITYKDLRTRR